MPFDPFFSSANTKPKKHSPEVNKAWDEFLRKDIAQQKQQIHEIYAKKDAGERLSDIEWNILRRNGIRKAFRRTLFTRTALSKQHKGTRQVMMGGFNTAH